jgi:activator of 2-hydroxyglutaryl-CoA dehydratase
MSYVLGIDIGSGYSKAVICLNGHIYSWAVMPSGGDYKGIARMVAEAALKKAGLSMEEVSSVIATGYGANMVDFANHTVTDISSHATGIKKIFQMQGQ